MMKKLAHYEKVAAGDRTPVEVLNNLTGSKKFLLESTYRHEKKGKYSFLGRNPAEEIIGRENETAITDLAEGTTEIRKQHVLEVLKNHLPKLDIELPLPFTGGAVGYIGYDAAHQEKILFAKQEDDLKMPDAHFMVFEDVIVFDHSTDDIYLVTIQPEHTPEQTVKARIDLLKEALKPAGSPAEKPEPAFSHPPFEPQLTKAAFMEKVERVKAEIEKGEFSQVVLSQRMTAEIDRDPAYPYSFYALLRKSNPSPYMFFVDFEDYIILGASPESLVQTNGREVVTNPIAGTRPRGRTLEEDGALKKELLSSRKELAEHDMLVDLSVGELHQVCKENTVEVPTYMNVEKYQHVMHIVSEVRGELEEHVSSIDALKSCLPAGTVSGSPKVKAMQLISELEEKKRGAYAGGIGYINFQHDLNIALTIRSLIIKNGRAYLQAGAGIVADSDAEMEYEETRNKAKSLLDVLQTV